MDILEQKRDLLIKELDENYDFLSEEEIEELIDLINKLDAYIDEWKYLSSL